MPLDEQACHLVLKLHVSMNVVTGIVLTKVLFDAANFGGSKGS